jgi:DNA-binding transcriptional ArsR family regulator
METDVTGTAQTASEQGHEALERIFHEPSRLAIMSALCAAERGLAFVELRDACRLTDGNLNRHLKVLEEAGAVRIDKRFVDNKPRTTVRISAAGLSRFQEYLEALSLVLKQAQQALPSEAGAARSRAHGALPVRA